MKINPLLIGCFYFSALSYAESGEVRWKHDIPKTESECLERKGYWGKVGIPGNPYPPSCTVVTKDSGKACSNPEDCEGYCVIPKENLGKVNELLGVCSKSYPLFGCITYLQDGKKIGVCAD